MRILITGASARSCSRHSAIQDFIAAAIDADVPKLVLLSSGASGDREGGMIKDVHAEIEAQAAMPTVAEQDIAAVIAACLTQQVGRDTYEVTGPRSLTQMERLELLARHITGTRALWTGITETASP